MTDDSGKLDLQTWSHCKQQSNFRTWRHGVKRPMLYTRLAMCVRMHMTNEKLILTLNPNANPNHNRKTNSYISAYT